jgi:hypothetical protein
MNFSLRTGAEGRQSVRACARDTSREASRIPRRAGALAAGLLALAVAMPASAETGAGTFQKDVAIIGTVATYAVALVKGGPVGSCLAHPGPGWGVRAQAGWDHELSLYQVGAEGRNCELSKVEGFSLDMSSVASLGLWTADSGPGTHTAVDVAYVPMLHWRAPASGQLRVDLEFGIGPMLLSDPNVGYRLKGTNFQFSDQFGIGIGSTDGKWRVGYAFRHVSNLDISANNDAVDFSGIVFSYRP